MNNIYFQNCNFTQYDKHLKKNVIYSDDIFVKNCLWWIHVCQLIDNSILKHEYMRVYSYAILLYQWHFYTQLWMEITKIKKNEKRFCRSIFPSIALKRTLVWSLPTSPWQVNCIAVSTGNCRSGVSYPSFSILTLGISIKVGLTETEIKGYNKYLWLMLSWS